MSERDKRPASEGSAGSQVRNPVDPARSGELNRLIIVGLVLMPIAMAATCVIAEIRELPWWCRIRAGLGSTAMQYKMGRICADAEDNRGAEEWLRRAAENGSVEAQYELAMRFAKDEVERLTLLKLAAGNDYAEAQYELGTKYFQVGPEHYAAAVEWYQMAAAQGLPKAQHALAGCLLRGDGVPADRNKAKELYQQAAAQGYGPSEARLEELAEEEKKKASGK